MKSSSRFSRLLAFALFATAPVVPGFAADLVGFGLEPVSVSRQPSRASGDKKSLQGVEVRWNDGRLVFAFTKVTQSRLGSGGVDFSYATQLWNGGRKVIPFLGSDFAIAGLSADGTAAGGTSHDPAGNPFAARAIRPEIPPQSILQSLATPMSAGTDISGDGLVVVGSKQNQPMRWSSVDGSMVLPLPVGATGGEALATNADGSVVVGYADGAVSDAFLWTSSNGTAAFTPPAGASIVPTDLSADGTFVIGRDSSGLPYRWTTEGNQTLLSARAAVPLAISGNGSYVAGYFIGPDRSPFIWDAVHGARDLRDVLTESKVNLRGWKLREAASISTDGQVIAGRGEYLGQPAGWIVRLDGRLPQPPPVLLVKGLRFRYPAATSAVPLLIATENARTLEVRSPGFAKTLRTSRGRWNTVSVPFPEDARSFDVIIYAIGEVSRTRTVLNLRRGGG